MTAPASCRNGHELLTHEGRTICPHCNTYRPTATSQWRDTTTGRRQQRRALRWAVLALAVLFTIDVLASAPLLVAWAAVLVAIIAGATWAVRR